MLKKIKCTETGVSSSNCDTVFTVTSAEGLSLKMNDHYKYEEPHKSNRSEMNTTEALFDENLKKQSEIIFSDKGELIEN